MPSPAQQLFDSTAEKMPSPVLPDEDEQAEAEFGSESSETVRNLREENSQLKALVEGMKAQLEEKERRKTSKEITGRRPSKDSAHMSERSVAESLSIAVLEGSDDMEQVMRDAEESEDEEPGFRVDPRAHVSVIMGSALSKSRTVQVIIYMVALGLMLCVFFAKSPLFKDEFSWLTTVEDSSGSSSGSSASSSVDAGSHRRLAGGPSELMLNVAFCTSCAGLLAFLVSMVRQPMILGYLLGGVMVGPTGLDIIHNQSDIQDLSALGLVFLLFMIGLELDVSELLKMGRVVIGTGLVQFPLCLVCMFGLFTLFESGGLSLGGGQYSTLYCAASFSISSTMIVVKLLGESAESETAPGRLSIGILIFQDLWAIVVLALQPKLDNPEVLGLMKTFGMIIGLVVIALSYAKWVMPAVLLMASNSVELMLVVALAWCFFMCCLASFPAIGLSMELAALVSGVALATFPYSAEFNGKIKYIRDFFIMLFFVGLGMQIPPPDLGAIGTALLLAFIALAIRWVGMFAVIRIFGGNDRLAVVSTINLSQTSEFGLVICTLGVKFGHIEGETLTLVIWTFSLLAVLSSNVTKYNYTIYGMLASGCRRCLGRKKEEPTPDDVNRRDSDDFHTDRDIIFLGFHQIGAMLLANLEHTAPQYMRHIHVIDVHQHIMGEIRKKGVTCSYGDITSADVLEHAYHGDARLVIISIPDAFLHGTSNMDLLKLSKKVWPSADVICTAESHFNAHELYAAGADYVLRMAKLCAERLKDVIVDHTTHATHHHSIGEELNLNHVFEFYKNHDDDKHLSHIQVKSARVSA